LLVEVTDSSLLTDRFDKARIYARAGIPLYWILNLQANQVEVHSHPAGDTYTQLAAYGAGSAVPLELDGTGVTSIPVSGLLAL